MHFRITLYLPSESAKLLEATPIESSAPARANQERMETALWLDGKARIRIGRLQLEGSCVEFDGSVRIWLTVAYGSRHRVGCSRGSRSRTLV